MKNTRFNFMNNLNLQILSITKKFSKVKLFIIIIIKNLLKFIGYILTLIFFISSIIAFFNLGSYLLWEYEIYIEFFYIAIISGIVSGIISEKLYK